MKTETSHCGATKQADCKCSPAGDAGTGGSYYYAKHFPAYYYGSSALAAKAGAA